MEQALPNHGVGGKQTTKGSKGISRLITRSADLAVPSTAMTASQMRIAETIDAFYGDAGAKDGVSRSYKQAVEDLDAETIKALDGPYR
ncbi:MAG: hypothetical protein LQ347_001392 [Umbilicaria vellea]|nr:MAG: hypothetical protein LQ347_001392 [Umbilicaria vellea]